MPPLSTVQKSALSQFTGFTQADKRTAERILRAYNWDVQLAVNSFYSSGGASAAPRTDPNAAPLNKLFDKYRDDPKDSPDTIGINGTMTYLSALSVSLEDITVLIISELLGSPTMGEIPRTGFVAGWSAHSATTLTAQKQVLSSRLEQLPSAESRSSNGLFRRVYKHTFKIALPAGSKGVPLEMAMEYWKLLFGPQGVPWQEEEEEEVRVSKPWLDWWLSFLQEHWKKAVNKDLWDQTLLFSEKTREDGTLSWWSEESAWPGVIDEFVEWAKTEKGVGKNDGNAMEVE